MEQLNNLEKAVLAKLFAGDNPRLAALRSQVDRARLTSRQYTGAGFVIFVRRGRLDLFEGYSHDEPWPDEIGEFELTYQEEPRRDPELPEI